jgi:hypothetical protein
MGPLDLKLLEHLRFGAEVCKKQEAFDTFERFVLEHGRPYSSQALTKEEAERAASWMGEELACTPSPSPTRSALRAASQSFGAAHARRAGRNGRP